MSLKKEPPKPAPEPVPEPKPGDFKVKQFQASVLPPITVETSPYEMGLWTEAFRIKAMPMRCNLSADSRLAQLSTMSSALGLEVRRQLRGARGGVDQIDISSCISTLEEALNALERELAALAEV